MNQAPNPTSIAAITKGTAAADEFVRAWVGEVPAGAIIIVFPGELRRFANTYRHLPPLPSEWEPMSAPFVYRR